MTTAAPAIDRDALHGILASVVAPWVAELDLQLQQASLGEVVLVCRWRPGMCTAAAYSAASR